MVAGVLATGNAVDAVVAGVFAASALAPSVLLGPVQILIGGAGAGLRAVDGRNQQPGRRAARPRGIVAGDPIPEAARVATPALLAALATCLASAGSLPLKRALGPAIELARAVSEERARVLKRIAQHGAAALATQPLAAELVNAAGRVAGGLLGLADLDELRPSVAACEITRARGRVVATVPWRDAGVRRDASHVEIVAATDARGLVAIACYEAPDDGLAIAELGLVAPRGASPVMRGDPRITPGEARGAAAPIALSEAEGIIDLALGISRSSSGEDGLQELFDRDDVIFTSAQDGLDENATEARVVGIARSRDTARAIHRRI